MRAEPIDYQDGAFHVTVLLRDRLVAPRSGSSHEALRYATARGEPRGPVTLTPAAQEAARAICFGGTA